MNLSSTLEAICEEVTNETNFKPFIIFGGPNPKGTGGIQIFQYVLAYLHCCFIHWVQRRFWGGNPDRRDVSTILGSALGGVEG